MNVDGTEPESTPRRTNDRPGGRGVARATPRWRGGLVLVCGKCLKRLDGNGERKAARRLLRKVRERLGRAAEEAVGPRAGKVKLVRTKCLGICPKDAFVVLAGTGAAGGAGSCLVVKPAARASDVAAELARALPVVDAGRRVKGERPECL